jgi:hypothetical protein
MSHRGEAAALVKYAFSYSAVAENAQDRLVCAKPLGGHGCACSYAYAAADYRVRAEMTESELRDVHAAASAPAVALLLPEKLCPGSEKMVLHCAFSQLLI